MNTTFIKSDCIIDPSIDRDLSSFADAECRDEPELFSHLGSLCSNNKSYQSVILNHLKRSSDYISSIEEITEETTSSHSANNSAPASRFFQLNRWDGYISSIISEEETVEAILTDSKSSEVEHAVFSIEEFSQGDRELLRPGCLIEWQIGYKEIPSRLRTSEIRVRRIPLLTPEAIMQADKNGEDFYDQLDW